MKALVITIPRERWPASMTNHWHIVDSIISRHLVTAVEHTYVGCKIEGYEWDNLSDAPLCRGCGRQLGERRD